MAIHWRVRFKSIGGTDYSVNIYDETYSGNPVDLKGGARPFETGENYDKNIIMPVRISTGYIKVINTGNLTDVFPMTPKARYVTLTSGNDTLWQGYIKQEQFTQPWDTTPYEISFPVVSALGILEGNQIEKGDVNELARVAEYLDAAITATGATYTTIVFPAEMGMQSGGPWDLLFRLGMQDINWFTYKNENLLDKTESRYDGVSWMELLQSIMMSFGYTLYEHGQTIYILSKTINSYLSIPVSALATLANNGTVTETEVTRQTIQISDLTIGGNDGTIDITLSSRRGVVEANINKFGADSTPNFDTKYLDFAGMVTITRENAGSYGTYYFNEEVGVYEPIQGQAIWTFKSYYNGVEQTWNAQDITHDYHMAAFCRRKSGEDVIIINYNDVGSGTGWGGSWTCSIKSQSKTFFAGGHLVLKGLVDVFEGEGASIYGVKRAKFMLRVGEHYYDADNNSWVTTPTTFSTLLDESSHQISPFSTVNSGPDDWFYIPVPATGIYGDVELFIFDPWSTAAVVQLEATYMFRNMGIDYAWPVEDVFKDYPVTDTNRFVQDLNLFANDDMERNINLTSFINERMGTSVLLQPDLLAPLQKIQSRNQGNVYFEQLLLKAIHDCYYRPSEIITIPVKQVSVFSPIDSYYWNGSHYYMSCENKWRDDLQTLKISKTL